ncbi:MAG: fibronectin type III domain-containing protein, partial [Candidatus Brocadiia bacterium]
TSDYTDTGVTNDTTYYYVVTAVDTSSNESGYSNEASATPTDSTAPAAPTGLVATAVSDSQIDLDWDDNTEPDLDSYNVYRDTVQIATDVTTSSYSDTGLSASTQYCYTVTAVDTSANESAESAQDCATTQSGGATTCHVDSITVTLAPGPGPHSVPHAEVVILDDGGAPVEGATVIGSFSGDVSESGVSDVTDATGLAVIEGKKAKNLVSITFCVDNVTHSTLTYDSGANVETCDSN